MTVAAIVSGAAAAIGYPLAEDKVATIVTGAVALVSLFVARRHTTPSADPRLQTTIAVRPTNGEEHAGLPPVSTAPVITFSGKR